MAPKRSKDSEHHSSRESLINSLRRNKEYVLSNCSSMISAELEARLSLVESTFTQLNTIQSSIEQITDDAIEWDTRQVIEELYCEIKAKILSALSNRGRHSVALADPAANSTMMNASRISKLPKLTLPRFSGKFIEWTSWFNAFTTLVESDNEIDELSKFIHLKSCLDASPLRTIDCLELSPENYRKALQLLRERFENKAIIVQSHVCELFNVKPLKQSDADCLGGLVDSVNSHLGSLRSLVSEGEMLEAIIFHLIRGKLDDESLEKWEAEYDCSHLPSWSLLSQFICNRGRNLAGREVRKGISAHGYGKGLNKRTSLPTTAGDNFPTQCYSCSGPHQLKVCPKFKELTPLQRYHEVKKQNLCLVCFNKRHQTKDCKASRCSICSKPHHLMLHRESSEMRDSGSNNNQASSSALHSSLLSNQASSFLATGVVLVKAASGEFHSCRCVLDSGSQLNFVTDRLSDKLKLRVDAVQYSLNGIGNAKSNTLGEVSATFKSRVTSFSATERFCVLPEITEYRPVNTTSVGLFIPRKLKLADPEFDSAKQIDMLIGVNLFFKLIIAGQIKMGANKPVLQKSLLGWIVVGECGPNENATLICNALKINKQEVDKLHSLVEKFWQTEDVPKPLNKFSEEEQNCESYFASTVKISPANRIIVRLPFKEPKVELGESYDIALGRFLNLEKKLNRNSELKKDYTDFIEEYRNLDHLEEVNTDEIRHVKYIMPHHPVIRPDSATTKLRVVFDASCKTTNGVSLNETMLVGPTLQPDLFETLTRFRFYRYALTADISKMYRQILVDSDDCNWQCILWRQHRETEIKVLRLKTVTYGTNSAPFLAVRCLYYLAELFGNQYPLAKAAVFSNFYMDDMLCGAESISELYCLRQEVTELLKKGGFELHKWRTNFRMTIDNSECAEPLELKTTDTAKTLGIYWNSIQDRFNFAYTAQNCAIITKRVVLSELAQLFDPLGFLSPVLILGKIFMQELWLLKQEWDEELPPSYSLQWQKYRKELSLVHECSLARSVLPVNNETETLELHGFSDASCRAYGAAIYARAVDKNGCITVNLVTAKSKVSPVRAVSLPRLELEGAKLLAQLMAKIKTCVPLPVHSTKYFTDSTIVLNWISSQASRWTTFVANRVALIQELSSVQDWNKVDTKLNPADIVSRGMHTSDLKNSELWWQGPRFLQLAVETWPPMRWQSPEEPLEQRASKFSLVAATSSQYEDIVSQCKFVNSFTKLTRVFAYIFRWRRAFLKVELTSSEGVTAVEIKGGLKYIIFNIQHLHFNEEISKLQKCELIRSPKILGLSPFLDISDGIEIMRVGGRLSQANVPYEVKHPILLPNTHVVINALFEYVHRSNMHAGAHAICAFVRQQYWVINARKVARRTVRSCIACFRQRPQRANQIMGALPANRVQIGAHPFERAGLDFAGPLWMHYNQRGRRPTKVYLCVFVCFLTKACHLELVSDLSTNAFIAALKRFFARRGLSVELSCDNATNFVGAARELGAQAEQLWNEKPRIINHCSKLGVQFRFIPPRSPHFGGLWESAVKVAKQLIIRCFNGASLNYEELSTAIAQVEAVMNSRPLHPMSSDPNDLEALTPGHFLVGRPLNSLTEPCDDSIIKLSMTNRWKRIVAVHHSFWQRWSNEYLNLLQERSKWALTCNNIENGMLVLIAEDNTPPGRWALGRVVECHPGNDKAVRVVTIKTKAGLFKRNIHKICPLPIEEVA